MNATDFLIEPGDEAMIAKAITHARSAGVPESEIERVIAEELEQRDEFTVPVLSGRLSALARLRQPARPPGESPPTARREPDSC